MVTYENIFKAYYSCMRHKRHSDGAMKYFQGMEEDLICLADEINRRLYTPTTSTAFIINMPKKREVFAACFRDRIVHHYIMLRLEPLFEQVLGERTFNCRRRKGVLYGVKTLLADIKECSKNYTQDCYIMKMDLQGFFMSIDKEILLQLLVQFIEEKYYGEDKQDVLWLTRVVVGHNPEQDCVRRSKLSEWDTLPANKSLFTNGEGKGMPIGNLTSQHFANYYLHHLDKYIESLGFKYYGRYVDDFYIVGHDKSYMLKCVDKIRTFLYTRLRITLHPKKFYIQHFSKGVTFTGAIVKFNRVYPARRTKGNFHNAVKRLGEKGRDIDKDISSVNSYLGIMIHYNSYAIRSKELMRMSEKAWKKVYVKGKFKTIKRKKQKKENR